MIGGYTLVDGTGARVSGNAPAYIAWLFALDCLPLMAVALLLRRRTAGAVLKAQWRTGALGGALALGAYGTVICLARDERGDGCHYRYHLSR